jgi:hypothetical protein
MSNDSVDIPLRVWVLKGGVIGAALMFIVIGGAFIFAANTLSVEGGFSPTECAKALVLIFSFCYLFAIPTALLVGLAHRGLCRIFSREHKSIFAATLVGTSVICFLPVLVHLIPLKNLPIYDLTGLIVFFGFVPSLAAVVATTVVLRR